MEQVVQEAGVSRALDIATTLGAHDARLTSLERQYASMDAHLREIRDMLRGMHNSAGAPASASMELLLGRVLDKLGSPPPPPPPQPPVAALVEALAARGGASGNQATGLGAIVGYVMGAGTLAWIVRGLLGI